MSDRDATCAICMAAFGGGEATTTCPSCRAPYHVDCWGENGGCAAYGCSMAPATDALTALEIPAAFWGHDDKLCPRCGKSILAIAVRCKHCGAELRARPEAPQIYQRRIRRQVRAPRLRRSAMAFLVIALIPVLAVVTAVGGLLFYRHNRGEMKKLGSYDGLMRIAIGVATAQSIIIVVALAAFWAHDAVLR